MNIVITSKNNNLKAKLDPRFGRAAWFCLYNTKTKETSFIQNEYIDSSGGAGTKAAELIVRQNVKKVISGDFGPKAKSVLEKFNIQMIMMQNGSHSIQGIIDQIQE